MATEKCRFFYRHNDTNKNLEGVRKSNCAMPGLALCYKYDSNSNQIACVKLVRSGSASGGQTGLFVRHNGIVFEASGRSMYYANCKVALDDCGKSLEISSDVTSTISDGWYFGNGIDPKTQDTSFRIEYLEPWTIAFKVKGTSSTGSPYPSHILHVSSTGEWTPKKKSTVGELFAFGMFSNGQLMFRDYFVDIRSNGSVTDWRDVKITFYPKTTTVYNSTLKQDVRPLDFTLTDNDNVINGTTYYATDYDDYEIFEFMLSKNGAKWSTGVSDYASPFNGYIKYISIAQDESGYSDYVRPTHKVALYFD